MADESAGFDERLKAALEEDLEGLVSELRAMATSSVKAEIRDDPCPKCGCQHVRYLSIPDVKTKLQLAEWLANRGFGRPGQAASEDEGERIVFERVVYMSPDDAS